MAWFGNAEPFGQVLTTELRVPLAMKLELFPDFLRQGQPIPRLMGQFLTQAGFERRRLIGQVSTHDNRKGEAQRLGCFGAAPPMIPPRHPPPGPGALRGSAGARSLPRPPPQPLAPKRRAARAFSELIWKAWPASCSTRWKTAHSGVTA